MKPRYTYWKQKWNSSFFSHDDREEHFKALDGLRGLAVLIVLLSHASNLGFMFADFLNFQKIGKIGVYLFFVLSAYLLDRQIAIAFITRQAGRLFWKNYFLRRFLRIYPLYTVSLLFFLAITWIGFPTVIQTFEDVAWHMMLLRGESIFWSIPVEFKYYFFSPLVMFVCHRYLKWSIQPIFIFFLILTATAVYIELSRGLPVVSTLRYLPLFLAGTFFSIAELLNKRSKPSLMSALSVDFLGVVAFALILLSVPYYFHLAFDRQVDFHHSVFYLPYAIVWTTLLLAAKGGKGFIRRVLSFKPLRFLGAISYSLYLFHMPVLQFLQADSGIPHSMKIYLFFIISIFISMLTYAIIEVPLSRIRLYNLPLLERNIAK